MTVYISRRAKLKFNIGVYYESARNFLLWMIGILGFIALGLIIVCLILNSQFTRLDIEAGEYISAAEVYGDGWEFGDDYDTDCVNHAGVYYFTVSNGAEKKTVRLSVKDTQAPKITVKDIYFAVNRSADGETYYPSVFDFIDTVYEPDDFTGEFLSAMPDMKKLGSHEMQIRFTDASGNKTEIFTVKMTQISDNLPPTVTVSDPIICEVGGTVQYKPYVTLTDNCIGELSFEVDESELRLDEAGEYYVTIVGKDRVGNKSERVRATVMVIEAYSEEKLDGMLDELVDDISPEGKSKEQICREIYKLVRGELVYTGDSQKGDVKRAVYHALMGGGGDCYSYFALSKLLLERCGVQALDVERISASGEETHFWSLVNIGEGDDGQWYHFDATELRPDRYSHSGCLLTDKQINAYSKARKDFYRYDRSGYPTVSDKIITPTPTLEELY